MDQRNDRILVSADYVPLESMANTLCCRQQCFGVSKVYMPFEFIVSAAISLFIVGFDS